MDEERREEGRTKEKERERKGVRVPSPIPDFGSLPKN